MPFFSPPTDATEVPPIDVDSEERRDLGWRLMRHYRSRPAGRNVFILSDDTATENDPWDITTGPTVVRTFHGGREGRYEVDAAEEAILEAAGYTVEDV